MVKLIDGAHVEWLNWTDGGVLCKSAITRMLLLATCEDTHQDAYNGAVNAWVKRSQFCLGTLWLIFGYIIMGDQASAKKAWKTLPLFGCYFVRIAIPCFITRGIPPAMTSSCLSTSDKIAGALPVRRSTNNIVNWQVTLAAYALLIHCLDINSCRCTYIICI